MFDKNGFFYTEKKGFEKYLLDIGLSKFLEIDENYYIIFKNKSFLKKSSKQLNKGMFLVTEYNNIEYNFDKEYFISGLVYYQKNLKDAIIKSNDIETYELLEKLYSSFGLKLKLREHIKIEGNYPSIEEINNLSTYVNLHQAISFILALASVYGDWNIIEENNKFYLDKIIIRFPFNGALGEYKQIIFNIEDILVDNKIYNKLFYTKKQEFIWELTDTNLLKAIGNNIYKHKDLSNFLGIENKLDLYYEKNLDKLKRQLFTDFRININNFKLTEVENIKLKI